MALTCDAVTITVHDAVVRIVASSTTCEQCTSAIGERQSVRLVIPAIRQRNITKRWELVCTTRRVALRGTQVSAHLDCDVRAAGRCRKTDLTVRVTQCQIRPA